VPVGPASGGGGGRANDVRAGGAYVEVSARDRLSQQLAGLLAKTRAFAASLARVGKVTAFAGVAGLTPLAGLFGAGINRAAQIEDMAEQLGFSVEQMQRLKFAADAAGVSVEDVLRKPEKYAGLMDQATVFDVDTIKQAAEASRSLAGAWINIQAALLPLIRTLGPIIQGFAKFVQLNAELLTVATVAAAGVTALGVGMFALGTATKVALSPLVLISGAVAGIGYALYRLAKNVFPETTAAAVAFFGDIGGLASDTFSGIIAAIAKGDLSLAWEVATAGALAVWKRFSLEMTGLWVDFKNFVLDGLRDIKAGFLAAFDSGLLKRLFRGEGIVGAVVGEAGPGGAIDAAARARNEQRDADRAFRQEQIDAAQAEADQARKRLADLVRQAQQRPEARPVEELSRRIVATRGAFRLLGDAGQQFGRVDQTEIQKKQLGTLEKIAADMKVVADGVKAGQLLLRFR